MRHICGISGGKDSSALALHLRERIPELEYFFCDTGAELPETYQYLDKLEIALGKKIVRLNSKKGFQHWFEVYRGTLPSPQMRWCTVKMKLEPIEAWVGSDDVTSYVAIRADELNRTGYVSTRPNIRSVFPFIEDGIDKDGVLRILSEAGLGLPSYYEWRTRSGCYFCFFQRKAEWIALSERHPDLWERAVAIEQKVMRDASSKGDTERNFSEFAMKGRQYTWTGSIPLSELLSRKDEILKKHQERLSRERIRSEMTNRPLWEVLGAALDSDSDEQQCSVCAL
jgi:3'-phosphoadenosine 5'-phosphosulfate sulfotransferase (PAPS reductase)/FAD synthetase